MRTARRCALVGLLATIVSPVWSDVTAFRQPIREQHGRILKLRSDVESAFIQERRGEDVSERIQARLCKESDAYQQLLNDFRNATTRHGLDEEFLLLRECVIAMDEVVAMYSVISGTARSATPPTEEETAALKGQVFEEIGYYTRDKLDEALKAEGLADILLAGSFEEARDEAVAQMRVKMQDAMADEMERVIGLRFYDFDTLGESLRFKARHLVEKGVAKLLVRVTSNELVVEWVAGVLIRWIGPKLREAFRVRGNHEARVARSAGTIEAARRRLNEFTGDANIRDVARAVADARRTINATRYLQSDLRGAGDGALLAQITDPIGDLERTISLTNRRFLLDKPSYAEHYQIADRFLREVRGFAKCSEVEVADDTDEEDDDAGVGEIKLVEFPPRFLIHVILTNTTGGPVEKDAWILHGGRPNEDGWIRTADGGGGTFSHKTDQTMGPYTNSHQLCPALKVICLVGGALSE